MRITPLSELEQRCSTLQVLMRDNGVDGVALVQNSDLFISPDLFNAASSIFPLKVTRCTW